MKGNLIMNDTDKVKFESFGKIPRLLKMPMIITEKIDGTNAQICISDDGKEIQAGSRKRFVTPKDDNFGFASWVEQFKDELLALGPGRHFGEWWGRGIQRGYGLSEKRFSLFNTGKWSTGRPECTSIVPVLYYGEFSQQGIEDVKSELLAGGSKASPGFMNPEGVIIYLPKANLLFKSTYDDTHKGEE
jgi:hypothetical protein